MRCKTSEGHVYFLFVDVGVDLSKLAHVEDLGNCLTVFFVRALKVSPGAATWMLRQA